MRIFYGHKLLTAVITVLFIVFLSLFARMLTAAEQTVAKDPVHLPADRELYRVVAGAFWQTNCYIIAGKNHEALVIDPSDELTVNKVRLLVDPDTGKSTVATPEQMAKINIDSYTDPETGKEYRVYWQYHSTGDDIKKIYDVLQQKKLVCKYIVITHGHIDHIAGLKFLKEHTGAKILMNRADTRAIDGKKLPPEVAGEKIDAYPKDSYSIEGGEPKVDQFINDGDLISLDNNRLVFQVMSTPGHSPGSITLRTRWKGMQVLFAGDTLFYHTIGRSNFRDGTGDHDLLLRTIREKFLTLPDNTIVYPGHYQPTTVGEEKRYRTLEQFQNSL